MLHRADFKEEKNTPVSHLRENTSYCFIPFCIHFDSREKPCSPRPFSPSPLSHNLNFHRASLSNPSHEKWLTFHLNDLNSGFEVLSLHTSRSSSEIWISACRYQHNNILTKSYVILCQQRSFLRKRRRNDSV